MTDEPQPTSELYLSPNDAHIHLQTRLGMEFSIDTLYFWIRQGAFPNKQSNGQANATPSPCQTWTPLTPQPSRPNRDVGLTRIPPGMATAT
jgi:hypothetical protein